VGNAEGTGVLEAERLLNTGHEVGALVTFFEGDFVSFSYFFFYLLPNLLGNFWIIDHKSYEPEEGGLSCFSARKEEVHNHMHHVLCVES